MLNENTTTLPAKISTYNSSDSVWDEICLALTVSELPLEYKEDSGWYGEGIISKDDYICVTPFSGEGNERHGTVSWLVRGFHMSGDYKTYDRFATLMDWYMEEAGLS